MTTFSTFTPRPLPAFGFMPEMPRLPPLPTTQEPGHPSCRAVAAYDISGAIQHFVLLLDVARSTAIGQQADIFGGFWQSSPFGCDMCRSFFRSAVSVSDQCAFTIFEACNHRTSPDNRPDDDTSDSDSDDGSHHYGLESDQQQDEVENLATYGVLEQFGYNPICGNLVVVKHSIVENLPAQIMDAELYDVLAEDFTLIHGLLRRYVLGDLDEGCADLLPSPFVFHRVPQEQLGALQQEHLRRTAPERRARLERAIVQGGVYVH
ncbi:hypothetical protein C8F01DRAFT_1079414 [Mycena amicta]|nr:hypothetical protein C8F01DRAFT_1079414 [Mycena amicta]